MNSNTTLREVVINSGTTPQDIINQTISNISDPTKAAAAKHLLPKLFSLTLDDANQFLSALERNNAQRHTSTKTAYK